MNESHGGKPWALSVKAVITDAEGRQLLLRRAPDSRHFKGEWEWPGGKVDPGEDFAVALAREVREECGLEVEFTGLAGSSEFELEMVRVVMVCLNARVTGGAMRLSEEHDDFAWIAPAELSAQELISAMKPVIRQMNDPAG